MVGDKTGYKYKTGYLNTIQITFLVIHFFHIKIKKMI